MNADFARSMIVNDLCDAMDKLVRRASKSPEAKGAGDRRPAPLASKQGNK